MITYALKFTLTYTYSPSQSHNILSSFSSQKLIQITVEGKGHRNILHVQQFPGLPIGVIQYLAELTRALGHVVSVIQGPIGVHGIWGVDVLCVYVVLLAEYSLKNQGY